MGGRQADRGPHPSPPVRQLRRVPTRQRRLTHSPASVSLRHKDTVYSTGLFQEIRTICEDFPGGPVGENPPANTGDGFNAWSRKMTWLLPRTAGELSPSTPTTKPTGPGPGSHCSEKQHTS